MGTPLSDRKAQVTEVLDRLHDEYPDASISLNYSNTLELLIAVILSAQCTDKRVNKVTEELFEKYETPADYANTSQEELAEDISSITYYNNKAKYIRSACQDILEKHDGDVPNTMDELTDLPGVGRKTANVVLQHRLDSALESEENQQNNGSSDGLNRKSQENSYNYGIVVDTHVQRLSRRLGLTEAETPASIEADLMDVVPESEWQAFTHLLISHGRAVCTARSPDCESCRLADICPSERGDAGVDLASGEAW